MCLTSSSEICSVFTEVVVHGAVTQSLTSVRRLVDQQTQDFGKSIEKGIKLVRQLLSSQTSVFECSRALAADNRQRPMHVHGIKFNLYGGCSADR